MNIAETRAKLEENHVPKDMYSFGWTTSEMMCIEYKKKHWEVYYSERGSRCGVKTFRKENEACKYFYDMVINVLWIYTPWSEIERFNLFKAGHKVLESYIASLKDFPKGLLPLGRTNNGVDIFWRDTNEDPDKWTLIVCEGSSVEFYEYAISITEFLAGVIKGTVQCDVLPENWSGAGHLDFIPYK